MTRAGSTLCSTWTTRCCRRPDADQGAARRAGQGKLHPQWDGPFTVRARQCLNIYTLALRRRMRRCPSIACKPSLRVPGRMGQEGEHEVEHRLARGVTHYRVKMSGSTRLQTTSGCGRRSWFTAETRQRNTTPWPPVAVRKARDLRRRSASIDAPPPLTAARPPAAATPSPSASAHCSGRQPADCRRGHSLRPRLSGQDGVVPLAWRRCLQARCFSHLVLTRSRTWPSM